LRSKKTTRVPIFPFAPKISIFIVSS